MMAWIMSFAGVLVGATVGLVGAGSRARYWAVRGVAVGLLLILVATGVFQRLTEWPFLTLSMCITLIIVPAIRQPASPINIVTWGTPKTATKKREHAHKRSSRCECVLTVVSAPNAVVGSHGSPAFRHCYCCAFQTFLGQNYGTRLVCDYPHHRRLSGGQAYPGEAPPSRAISERRA